MTSRIDHAGIQALLASPQVIDAVIEVGQAVKHNAKTIAPVKTGLYRYSIDVSLDGNKVVVSSYVPYAINVEAKYGTLVQALQMTAMGIRTIAVERPVMVRPLLVGGSDG